MPASRAIRVLSDLHLAHPASLIKAASQIEPLLEDVETVVFNGDTAELRLTEARAASLRHLDTIRTLCERHRTTAHFIAGNHDPEISEVNHLDLMDRRLLVTHGHALFPAIAPWGREAASLANHFLNAIDELGTEGGDPLENRLKAARLACMRVVGRKELRARTRLTWICNLVREMLHPSRSMHVLRAWAAGPDLAEKLLLDHRPETQCLLIGHTHLPGNWFRGEKLVVNTGSFLPWPGRRIVDITAEGLVVRKVSFDGKLFRPGEEVFHWTWTRPATISSHATAGGPA